MKLGVLLYYNTVHSIWPRHVYKYPYIRVISNSGTHAITQLILRTKLIMYY